MISTELNVDDNAPLKAWFDQVPAHDRNCFIRSSKRLGLFNYVCVKCDILKVWIDMML